LTLAEIRLDRNHHSLATILDQLATIYYMQGLYKESESLWKRDLEVQYELSNFYNIAKNLNNVADACYEQGKYAEAESYYLQAIEIQEKNLFIANPELAVSLNNNFGKLYKFEGKYKEAENLYIKALQISGHWYRLSKSAKTHSVRLRGNEKIIKD
jgi:tetratricopeptide (TPR) repeat protein